MMGIVLFLALLAAPAAIISVITAYRQMRTGWLYVLAAYLIGPLVLVLFLWRASFKRCPACHAECAWNADVCRVCLQPFPMRDVQEVSHV